MIDIKKKLMELLSPTSLNFEQATYLADYLVKNGVTVHGWISVTERLPEKSGLYITFGCTAVPVRWLHNFDKDIGKFGAWWNYEPNGKEHLRYRFIEAENITHWMPLPKPPKGE